MTKNDVFLYTVFILCLITHVITWVFKFLLWALMIERKSQTLLSILDDGSRIPYKRCCESQQSPKSGRIKDTVTIGH
jgi:hypothetical protein